MGCQAKKYTGTIYIANRHYLLRTLPHWLTPTAVPRYFTVTIIAANRHYRGTTKVVHQVYREYFVYDEKKHSPFLPACVSSHPMYCSMNMMIIVLALLLVYDMVYVHP